MDPFTQRMLEKAEQRSRALGISNAIATECSSDAFLGSSVADVAVVSTPQQRKVQNQQRSPSISSKTNHKMQVVESAPTEKDGSSSNKVRRHFTALDKENMDMGIEINIMTDKNVEVQIEVEEQDVTDDDNGGIRYKRDMVEEQTDFKNQPVAKLRDTSRSRLQRLGALYSNPNDLSSPIHRTEGQFHAGFSEDTDLKKMKQTCGKLVALANTINQWEDDTTHHQPKNANAESPSKYAPHRKQANSEMSTTRQKPKAPLPPTQKIAEKTTDEQVLSNDGNTSSTNKTKQLKWDPKVINSLEAQGFQRRDSSTIKLAYDYAKEQEDKDEEYEKNNCDEEEEQRLQLPYLKKTVKKTNESTTAASNVGQEEQQKMTAVKPGLVSGRAAAFEHKAAVLSQRTQLQQQSQKSQKDPTELSLRERMKLFENNKGEALLPKAAFGMAPSINKIRQDQASKKEQAKAHLSVPSTSASNSLVASVKPSTDNKVRSKVAELVASATTFSQSKILADINKQRQDDMQILANRFKTQKNTFDREQQEPQELQQTVTALKSTQKEPAQSQVNQSQIMRAPPPPPPLPPNTNFLCSAKRRSPGDAIDDDESKRARKSGNTNTTVGNRLYPALSDLESNASYSDDDCCCTTATVSADDSRKTKTNYNRGGSGDAHNMEDENESSKTSADEEGDDDDSSVGICNGSLGREIMQVVKKNVPQAKETRSIHYADRDYYFGEAADSSINSSDASIGVDDYLDEALTNDVTDGDDDYTQESVDDEDNNDEENTSHGSRGSKGTTASNSFSFRKTPKKFTHCHTISEEENEMVYTPNTVYAQPVKSELSVNQEDENMVTLVHTVSFYRRQQNANSANSTPVRKICREQQELASATLQFGTPQKSASNSNNAMTDEDDDRQSKGISDISDETLLVQEKIKKLLDEVCKQQQVIAQTSQALNLCAATIEFSGSTESVEGERHLLVATHRRQACLDEVQRLRVEKSLRPLGAPKEKGCLTVKEITVPLRQDYIRKLAAETISGHHLVCLLKYNEYVLATKTVPTLPGLLAVKFPDVLQLNNVYADFRITLEIYGMMAQREELPHEVKYHINLNKKSGVKTPKKKGNENRLVMPPVQSPAGPHVVRTPVLVQYGFAIFSLREIQRTTWSLTQVLGVCPLDGVVYMKVNCELSVSVEHKGFLTMFEDISGFGAWHRRWCHLNGSVLNYWKYPDDERKKAPMGSIDLNACCTQTVSAAPRDICARLHTILLVCQRDGRDTDRESLIIRPQGRFTIVRHLLSADTREEREEWCAYFNKALTLLRAWGPVQ